MSGEGEQGQPTGGVFLHPSLLPQFTMIFESNEFKVKLPDGHQVTFPNRLGHSHLSYMCVKGGFNITSFKYE